MAHAAATTLVFPSPVGELSPRRGVLWVLAAAACMLAIAAWLVVLLHLALVVRAEYKLADIVAQANAFAELPQVDAAELRGFVGRRLAAAGFQKAKITLASDARSPGKLRVVSVATSTSDLGSSTLGLARLRWLERPVVVGPAAGAATSPLLGAKAE